MMSCGICLGLYSLHYVSRLFYHTKGNINSLNVMHYYHANIKSRSNGVLYTQHYQENFSAYAITEKGKQLSPNRHMHMSIVNEKTLGLCMVFTALREL